jgi:hypothetical protein
LEVSLDHLLISPPSHFTLQKVRGLVVGFAWFRRGKQLSKKILLISRPVKKKIGFRNGLGFQAQIDDLRLKCGILRENPKKQEYRK